MTSSPIKRVVLNAIQQDKVNRLRDAANEFEMRMFDVIPESKKKIIDNEVNELLNVALEIIIRYG